MLSSRHRSNRRGASAYLSLSLSIAFNAASMILFRAMVGALSPSSESPSLRFLVNAAANWLFWAGALSFIVGLYFWIQSLKAIPLSLAYPTSASSYIVVALLARCLFGEPITLARAIGMGIIVGGVALLYSRGASDKA